MSDYFQHPQAIVESRNIGRGSRIWAFAHVLPNAVVGADCNLCDHTFLENDVVLGDRVTVKCGVQLWDGIRLEDDVFVGPNATFTNDPLPRSRQYLTHHPTTTVRRGASIGANATILPGLTIGEHAMVGAGAVVTRSVPAHAVVAGNPARVVRFLTEERAPSPAVAAAPRPPAAHGDILVDGVRLERAPVITDRRGSLSPREVGQGLPFVPQRCFLVLDVPGTEVRGEHAHRKCEQLLVCVKGSLTVVVDDGRQRQELVLDSADLGLYLAPMVWAAQYRFSENAALLVLASDPYDPDDYIRDYRLFLEERAGRSAET